MTERAASGRPGPGELAPYYEGYVARVPDGDLLATLAAQVGETAALLRGQPAGRGEFRYAPGKWSAKQVVRHVIDTEWVFAYRALAMGRGDGTPLPAMDENAWADVADVSRVTLVDLADELLAVRAAGVRLFSSFRDEDWTRRGTASGNAFTVRGLAWVVAGHELHHAGVLRARYFGDGA